MFGRHRRATLLFRKFPHSRGALWVLKGRLRIGAVVVLVQRLPLFRPVGFIGILVHRIPVAVAAVAESLERGEYPTVVLSRPRSISRGGKMARGREALCRARGGQQGRAVAAECDPRGVRSLHPESVSSRRTTDGRERYIENGSFAHVLHGLSSETDWPGRENAALGPGFGVRAPYGLRVRWNADEPCTCASCENESLVDGLCI